MSLLFFVIYISNWSILLTLLDMNILQLQHEQAKTSEMHADVLNLAWYPQNFR